MQSKRNENITTSFKNPFDDYNANVLAPELIVQYWYTPFNTGALKDFDEASFFPKKCLLCFKVHVVLAKQQF